MTKTIEEFFQAALAAPPAVREQAMLVLEGKAQVQNAGTGLRCPEPYLTLRDVSQALGISTTTLWRYEIPRHEFGGRPRYKLSEVENYLNSEAFQRRAADLRLGRKSAMMKTKRGMGR